MPDSGLLGPFDLTTAGVDIAVKKTSPGVFALGTSSGATFTIAYVGRCDSDVRNHLKKWIGEYDEFKFAYAGSPRSAFEKECNLFHDFGGATLDNRTHPARAENQRWKCPRCG